MFNDTIKYNIRYGRLDASDKEVFATAEAAQLTEFIEHLSDGWDTVVGERGLKLSGGEKQRVAIARALLKDPPIVVLDEATSALDTITERSVQQALFALGRGRTAIVIAHRLSTIRNAEQILVLDKGKIIERGNHEELLELRGHYATMWEQQESELIEEEVENDELMSEIGLAAISTPKDKHKENTKKSEIGQKKKENGHKEQSAEDSGTGVGRVNDYSKPLISLDDEIKSSSK